MNASLPFLCGIFAAFGATAAAAAPGDDNALALCDAFLAASAARTAVYRAEIRPAITRADAGPGRSFAIGPLAGGFTYRPKRYRELTPGERAAVWDDPGLAAFLRAARRGLASDAGFTASRGRPARITIPAGELLLPRPASIALPRP